MLVILSPFSSGIKLQLSIKKKKKTKKVKYTQANIIYSSTNSNLCFRTYDFGHERCIQVIKCGFLISPVWSRRLSEVLKTGLGLFGSTFPLQWNLISFFNDGLSMITWHLFCTLKINPMRQNSQQDFSSKFHFHLYRNFHLLLN